MTEREYDLVVLGGGPGGYTAAIRAAQKGLKTVLVESGVLGGTCLNRGCVPTKTLLQDTCMIAAVRNCQFLKGEMKISLKRLIERKDAVVEGSRAWVANVLNGNGVTVLEGDATFTEPRKIAVKTPGGAPEIVSAPKTIIATGAQTQYDEGLHTDGIHIWSTDDALTPGSVPRSLTVIGAGNRGVEFASMYRNLGSQVILIEKEKRILPRVERGLASRYKKTLIERQFKVLTRTRLVAARPGPGDGVALTLETEQGQQELQTDRVLLTGSRRPSYQNLNLAAAGLSPAKGILESGPGMQTQVEGIYVVGDAAGSPYYAHKAIAQALVAVNHILGADPDGRPQVIPNCIYGEPELGSVGMTEDEARKAGRGVKVGQFYFVGNGRSGTMGNEQGIVKILSDSKKGVVLGVHIIGPQATELISLASLAMQNGVDIAGIKKTVFPHPTLSETLFEAALATDGEAIHMLLGEMEGEAED
jgi:dihydrolipoamide dehydrogenase